MAGIPRSRITSARNAVPAIFPGAEADPILDEAMILRDQRIGQPLRAGTAVQGNRGTIGAADGRILDIMSCFETGECPAEGALVSPCPSMIGDWMGAAR